LLGRPEYSEIRQEILKIINQKYLLYQTKLVDVNAKLRELTGSTISFILYSPHLMEKLKEISTCLVKKEGQCKESDYCLLGNGDVCSLLIPKNNLLTGSNNEVEYFDKIADELVRYSRIKHFVFEPQAFLSFSSVKYNLRENEMIVIQSLLNQDFFVDLVPAVDTEYIQTTSYDTINPLISVPYAPIYDIKSTKTIAQPYIEISKKSNKKILVQPAKSIRITKSAEVIEPVEVIEPSKVKETYK